MKNEGPDYRGLFYFIFIKLLSVSNIRRITYLIFKTFRQQRAVH
jgi:hypothetical protein